MSANRRLPHVVVLPEDNLDRELAIGFRLFPSLLSRNMDVLNPAGGWMKVLEQFKSIHVRKMNKFEQMFMVLIIDFDYQGDRLSVAKREIPAELSDRVFILGVWSNPEDLKRAVKEKYKTLSCEEIGEKLAQECHLTKLDLWGHDLLKHNQSEIARMQNNLAPILFPV